MSTPHFNWAPILHRIMLNVMEGAALWEIPVDLEKALPTHSSEECIDVAKKGLAILFQRRWFELQRRDRLGNDDFQVVNDDVLNVLAESSAWKPPSGSSDVYFVLLPTADGLKGWDNGGWYGS